MIARVTPFTDIEEARAAAERLAVLRMRAFLDHREALRAAGLVEYVMSHENVEIVEVST